VGVRQEVDANGRTVSRYIKKGVRDFSFGHTLGEGSYSTVVLATDRQTLNEYAIKILDKRHIIKEKKVKYVNIEKDTLNRLTDHPGIVPGVPLMPAVVCALPVADGPAQGIPVLFFLHGGDQPVFFEQGRATAGSGIIIHPFSPAEDLPGQDLADPALLPLFPLRPQFFGDAGELSRPE